MCHEYTARNWVRESEAAEATDEAEDELPEFLAEDSETPTELVTDGGDES